MESPCPSYRAHTGSFPPMADFLQRRGWKNTVSQGKIYILYSIYLTGATLLKMVQGCEKTPLSMVKADHPRVAFAFIARTTRGANEPIENTHRRG